MAKSGDEKFKVNEITKLMKVVEIIKSMVGI